MKDITVKLQMRLKSIARNNWHENKEQGSQCALMYIELFRVNGEVAGWLKPEVRPIEPRDFKPVHANGLDWPEVVDNLLCNRQGVLLVQRGEPVEWLSLTG